MKVWPRSLLWRTVALLVPLLVLSQLAWFGMLSLSDREPRARQVAERVASVVNLTRAALVGSRPERRRELLVELNESEGIRVYPDDDTLPPGILGEGPIRRYVAAELVRRLGEDTLVYDARGTERGLWVSFRIDEDRFWVVLPPPRARGPFPWTWFAWGLLVLGLSIVGAYLIVNRITRPLRAAVPAAAALGRGEEPPPLPESGPYEVAALGRAFNEMARDIRELDEARKLLLAGISHDLRTPLARLRLGVEMMPSSTDSALADGMVQDIEDMDAIIDQFLAYVRESRNDEIAVEADVNALVRTVVERFDRQGTPVRVKLDALPAMRVRPLSFQRMLGNLIDNAFRHARVPASVGAPGVEVRTGRLDPNTAFVAVLDRGPGIAEADRERVLQPFQRVDAARTDKGSGLGLAIVERIARLHGGRIVLAGRDGGGLEARIELPFT
ncbi:MAG: HAMP domain-containing protein [Proteobacteria bacterium]|nr:HAMP domain-containing protein [Burkholderiales bacterium]